jgi:DNA processing protein
MFTLSGFWSAAARRSGRIDFSVLDRKDPSDWSPAQVAASGLPEALTLCSQLPIDSSDEPLPLSDHRYPTRLADIPFAPPVLFYRGDLTLLSEPSVAIVGSRRCTAQGRQLARQLAARASAAGAVVISGMAHGIDEAAHAAAAGRTVAVLGHALDAHLGLGRRKNMDRILQAGGLILSEFPPATQPSRFTFPIRNRVIAWLSMATVVVEADISSGALITARAALGAGSDVYAVPGHPLNSQSAGCLALIEAGAPMIRSGAELVRRLGLIDRSTPHPEDPLLTIVGGGASLDELLAQIDSSPAELIRRLAALELSGILERLPGDRYALTPR